MIIGEALNRRSDLQRNIAQLQERVRASVLVQEGDEPPESAEDLLTEVGSLCDELERLLARINHTNAITKLSTGETVTEALARRDVLELRQGTIQAAIRAASNDGFTRYSRSEVRMLRQINVSEIQKRLDGMSRARRELDNQLQEQNWTTSLVE